MPVDGTTTVTITDSTNRVVVAESPTEVTVQEVTQAVTVASPGPKGRDGDGVVYYGEMSTQTNQTVAIGTAGTYVPMSVTGTLAADAWGVAASTTASFGLKNNSSTGWVFFIIASADIDAGNNHTIGIRLAKNGTAITESTCLAVTGNTGVAKLLTQWLVYLGVGDEISCLVTNVTNTQTLNVQRAKIVAFSMVGSNPPRLQQQDSSYILLDGI